MNILIPLRNWLLPQYCWLCKQITSTPSSICLDCQQALPWNRRACTRCALPIETGQECGICAVNPPAFTRSIVPFLYQPPISTFIIQLKFHHQLRCARILGQLLADSIRQRLTPLPQAIIPVPLHTRRLRQRGFNQAVELARPLSDQFNIPLLYDDCYRPKHTVPQSQLSARARRSNLSGAFALRNTIQFQHVAIVDDVMTTGQTVRKLSQQLYQHGIHHIDVWCCARAA